MKKIIKPLAIILPIITILGGCVSQPQVVVISPEELTAATKTGITEQQYRVIKSSQLFELSPRQTDQYLRILHELEPDLRTRIGLIAEKNIGQPYDLYLLGEAPFEPYDSQPLFELSKSDCVVFAEHTYAMGLADNWGDFFKTLQHIRYDKGEVGLVTRNHFTEYDWNRNNTWLVEDISAIAGTETTETYEQVVNKERFFAKQFSINVPIENAKIEETFVPNKYIPNIASYLQTGDFVNFVRGRGEGAWVGHVGIIKVEEDGTVNVIHSASPAVRKEGLLEMAQSFLDSTEERRAQGKTATIGFKFLRLQDDPINNLTAKFGGAVPPITMVSRKHEYLTEQQVKEKLQRLKLEAQQELVE
ncbi:MAG: DUF1460 domain-containing protein [Gammaproteobacteria bacterium]|nr:DUF1460 domain-containing protein [Gammaproteobacteria bacterium]